MWDDGGRVKQDLETSGHAVLPALLNDDACQRARALWDDEGLFRSRVVMARHGYGQGEYRYFANPLPAVVAALRETLYPRLADIANRWRSALGLESAYPPTLQQWLALCHAAGQTRPTPLLLRYGPGDYNCLHQDLYGKLHFPLQVAILLSCHGQEFKGGAFVLTEQRPRRQSRVEVVPLNQGDGVVFPVRQRPVEGARGTSRATMRHGVSRVLTGERFCLGLIFHDAQ